VGVAGDKMDERGVDLDHVLVLIPSGLAFPIFAVAARVVDLDQREEGDRWMIWGVGGYDRCGVGAVVVVGEEGWVTSDELIRRCR
jgi:hypothetical protein